MPIENLFTDDMISNHEPKQSKGEFPLFPEGEYVVTVFDYKQGETKNGGKPWHRWELKVQGGDHDGEKLGKFSMLTERALPYFLQDLELLGVWNKEMGKPTDKHLEAAIGKKQKITVQHSEYQGKTSENVYFNGPPKKDDGLPNFAPGADELPF